MTHHHRILMPTLKILMANQLKEDRLIHHLRHQVHRLFILVDLTPINLLIHHNQICRMVCHHLPEEVARHHTQGIIHNSLDIQVRILHRRLIQTLNRILLIRPQELLAHMATNRHHLQQARYLILQALVLAWEVIKKGRGQDYSQEKDFWDKQ